MNINPSLQSLSRIDFALTPQRINTLNGEMGLDNSAPPPLDSDPFKIGNTGEIDEEAFQHALVRYLLEEQDQSLASAYEKQFKKTQKQGLSAEDAVKSALSSLVENGLVTKDVAERVNGISFRAAQLDERLDALYDGRGGPGDDTIATASVSQATRKAIDILSREKSGELNIGSRALNAPSNTLPSTHNIGTHASGGSGEFLWKPSSESDGKLVVLFPSQYTGNILSSGIYEAMPPSKENLVEEGRFSGDSHNGGRAHFRFSRSGKSYPDNVYVVAQLTDGRTISFPIADGAARVSR